MSNASSFLKGFFTSVQQIAQENDQRASNYYERQLERAQTMGVERLQSRRAKAAEADAVAQRLMAQGNIPKQVIQEAAKGGLDGLGQLEQVWKSAAEANIPVDEGFWNDVYSVAKEDASITGKPIVESIGGVVKQATTPPEEKKRKKSIGGFLSGRDGLDRAVLDLEETEVVDGYSAAELLALPEETTPSSVGTINWSAISAREKTAAEEAAAKTAAKEEAERIRLRDEKRELERQDLEERRAYEESKSRPASVADTNTINKAYNEELEKGIKNSGFYNLSLPAGTPEYNEAYRKAEEGARKEALSSVVSIYGEEKVRQVPVFNEMLNTQEQPPQNSQASNVKPEGLMEKINIPGKGASTFSHMNKAGKPVYKTPDGGLQTVDPKVVTIPGKAAPESTNQGQATQTRLSNALTSLMSGKEPEGFFIGQGEQPPQNISSSEAGTLVLKQTIPEGFVYGLEGTDEQDILIPKQ